MLRKTPPFRSASICILTALALLFAASLAGCADTASPPPQPTGAPPAATVADTPSPAPQPTSAPSVAAVSASATTITVGDTVDGGLDDGDGRDYFRISGEENLVYDLSVAPGTLDDMTVVLYDSDLRTMMWGQGHPDTGEAQFVWPGYPGDYYISVEGGDGGGSYTLTLVLFPEDHGDGIPFASEVSLGVPVRGSMGYSSDFDYFRFRADADQLYRIEVITNVLGCWRMFLYDSDEEILANYHDFSLYRGVIVWEAPSSGDHYVTVMKPLSPYGCDSSEGEYTLTVAPMTRPVEDEHGNVMGDAALMEVGEPIAAGLEYAGDADYFRFRADKGRVYRMDLALGTFGTLDSYTYEINMYGPDGDEIEWSTATLEQTGYAWESPASGEYYVAITASGSETGSYTFTVTPIDDDHGKDIASATGIALGEPIEGDADYAGDRDYFRFRAEKGQLYRIDAFNPPTSYDRSMRLQLQDSKGNEVELWGKIWEAPETGDYYIGVEYPYSMGPYTLTVAQIQIPTADDHSNHRTAVATAIAVGKKANGYVNYDGDVDYFQFTADADQLYRIEVESGDLDHWDTKLYDSDGRHLSLLLPLAREGSRMWFTWKAPAREVHYISVSRWEHTGVYALTVVPVTDDHGDSAASATSLDVGKFQEGEIDYRGDVDYFSFWADCGRAYRIEILPDTLPGATIKLYDSESRALAVGWDRVKIGCSDCGEEWEKNARKPIVWQAPSSGYYYVTVEARLETVGSYELAIDHSTE